MADQIDTKTVSKLADILSLHGLTELEYETENCRICLTKDAISTPVQNAVLKQLAEDDDVAEKKVEDHHTEEQSVVDSPDDSNIVKSPMVGVVYLAPDTNKPDYVKVGNFVAEGDTVCLIEAMKTFNPVKAHKGGRIIKILVETGDPVEYGQPLMVIE